MRTKQSDPQFLETAALHITAAIIATRGADSTIAARLGLDGAIALTKVLEQYRKDNREET